MTKEEMLMAVGAAGDVPETLADTKAKIADGALRVGDIVLYKNDVPWRLVDLSEGRAVIMTAAAFTYAPFSRPDKRHPWGWNNYRASQLREELNSAWIEMLLGDEQDDVVDHEDERGRLWLLSISEAGFVQDDRTYTYFRGEDDDELDLKRQLIDLDGDSTYWWLRSPTPSYAFYERLVLTDGSLNNGIAYSGNGAVAACEIEL